MLKKLSLILVLLPIIASSCSNEKPATTFTEIVETAHQKAAFIKHDAIQFDCKLMFGGSERMNADITVSTNSEYAIIKKADSGVMYIAKDKVYANSELATEKKARFDAYTWTYFFLFPYKLSDRGTSWAAYDTTGMDKEFDVQKLTFAPNTGDAPDDWYITYASKKSHLIDHAAYIVTLGKTQAEAEENPHAIQYLDYRSVDGVPIAHRWVFWEWNKTDGLTKEIGEATLTNIHFVDGFTKDFKVPADLMEVE